MPDALRAREPDAVFRQQVFILIDSRRKGLQNLLHAIQSSRRRLKRQSANAEIAGHHALAADELENFQQLLAFAEAVEEHRHGAQVDRVGSEPHQMRADARQFGEQHANILRALGNFQPSSFSTARQ